ncbi:alpha/beta hydrolase [Brevibacillus centrosporus]|uniref:alpha/beta hydrolase n=1 Tax=Brevibacillus centrosporus TaxID=54910 RepID=UPI002E1D1909|nr:alpha/beta hydrolase [Brevibacillus centrosporus]
MAKLDPQAKVYLEAFKQMPAIHEMEPAAVRDMFAQIPAANVELEPLSEVSNRKIPIGHDTRIAVRIYTPAADGPFPVFVYYHGGGWVIGDLETADASCRMLANRTKSVVVSVDYRLAPEHKFPIPAEDSYAALEWAAANAASFHGDPNQIVVGGDSAGGNLSAVVSQMARDRKGPKIAAQVLIYPVTSLEYDTESYELFQKGFGLDRELMKWFGGHYIQNEEDKRLAYVSPLFADDVSRLPPAIIITAENDVLRDEGATYAAKLERAGVPVEYLCEPGMVHGYFTNMAVFSERIQSTIQRMEKFLNQHTRRAQVSE